MPKPKKKKRTAAARGKLSRNKGKAFELEIFPNAKRTLTQQRDSGEEPDISIPGWWVEAKSHAKVPIRRAFEQAVDEIKHAGREATPVAVTKDNGKEPLATLRLSDFVSLLKQIEDAKNFLALKADQATKVEVPIFKMAQPHPLDPVQPPRDHRDRPTGLDDGTV